MIIMTFIVLFIIKVAKKAIFTTTVSHETYNNHHDNNNNRHDTNNNHTINPADMYMK